MNLPGHQGIYISQASDTNAVIESLLFGKLVLPGLDLLQQQPAVFSDQTLKEFLEEEFLHGGIGVDSVYHRPLHQMSSGEQKRALLHQLIAQQTDYLILDELYDHIDLAGQAMVRETISQVAQSKTIIQILHRRKDALDFIEGWSVYENGQLLTFETEHYGKNGWMIKSQPLINSVCLSH